MCIKMSKFFSIHARLLIAFLFLTVNLASSDDAGTISKRRGFIEKLNEFVSYVDRGFQSVASSLKSLDRDLNLFGELKLSKLNLTVRALEFFKQARELKGTTAKPTAMCRDGWTMHGTSCFLFVECNGRCSPDDARKSCLRKQSLLAKVSSSSHEQFFIRMLNTSEYILLGGNDRYTEGTWRWPDGSLVNDGYTNWYKGQPNGGSNENCMELSVSAKKWYDEPCSGQYSTSSKAAYVCETSLNFL